LTATTTRTSTRQMQGGAGVVEYGDRAAGAGNGRRVLEVADTNVARRRADPLLREQRGTDPLQTSTPGAPNQPKARRTASGSVDPITVAVAARAQGQQPGIRQHMRCRDGALVPGCGVEVTADDQHRIRRAGGPRAEVVVLLCAARPDRAGAPGPGSDSAGDTRAMFGGVDANKTQPSPTPKTSARASPPDLRSPLPDLTSDEGTLHAQHRHHQP